MCSYLKYMTRPGLAIRSIGRIPRGPTSDLAHCPAVVCVCVCIKIYIYIQDIYKDILFLKMYLLFYIIMCPVYLSDPL